jgi:chitin disaccharide deacetylase
VRRLIFNADDYGLSPAVCAGILEAGLGVLRSTTVMANVVSDAELSALADSGLGCGVHLNLTFGAPLCANYPRSLQKLNAFDKPTALSGECWEDGAHRAAAWDEWLAQTQRLLDAGIKLDHADSHHHVHLHPQLFPLALQLARQFSLALRTSSAHQRQLATSHGVPTPDALVLDFYGNNSISRASLLAALGEVSGGVVEVMCHPGRVDDLLRQRSSYVDEREQELATLAGIGLIADLERNGWQIADYRVLKPT